MRGVDQSSEHDADATDKRAFLADQRVGEYAATQHYLPRFLAQIACSWVC